MHNVAHDYEFLKNCLSSTVKVDDFTGRLFKIYETVRAEGNAQVGGLKLKLKYLLVMYEMHMSIS